MSKKITEKHLRKLIEKSNQHYSSKELETVFDTQLKEFKEEVDTQGLTPSLKERILTKLMGQNADVQLMNIISNW